MEGLEPTRCYPLGLKPSASANFATSPYKYIKEHTPISFGKTIRVALTSLTVIVFADWVLWSGIEKYRYCPT